MEKNLFNSALIAVAIVLLSGCTSNDPEKLIVGTWEGVSSISQNDYSHDRFETDYETNTFSHYIDGQLQERMKCVIHRATLTFSEDGKVTEIFYEKDDEIYSIQKGTYRLYENDVWFYYPNNTIFSRYNKHIQTLTKHKLVLDNGNPQDIFIETYKK